MSRARSLVLCRLGCLLALTVIATGCAGAPREPTNAELLAAFDGSSYSMAPVAGEAGSADEELPISPAALEAIEHALAVTYATDFEHCFEREMDRLENADLAGQFSLEMRIDPDGNVVDTTLVDARAHGEDPELHAEFHGPDGVADRFHECVAEKALDWEVEHPPEAHYVHTHAVRMGEAW